MTGDRLTCSMPICPGAALKVTAAADGQSGLEAARRLLPAAVLLDIRLPASTDGRCCVRSRRIRRPATSR